MNPRPSVGDIFPEWRTETPLPHAADWQSAVRWEGPEFLLRLLDQVEDELEPLWGGPSDGISRLAAAALAGICRLDSSGPPVSVARQLHFLRFFVTGKAAGHALGAGRSSLAFDWLLCGVTARPFEQVEVGVPIEPGYDANRLWEFVTTDPPAVRSAGLPAVLFWLNDLFY